MLHALKSTAKAAARFLLRQVPLSVMQRQAGCGLNIPMYHAIAEQIPSHLKHLIGCRNSRVFKNDLDLLLRTGTPVTLDEVLAFAINGTRLPKNAFHLTCDDGLREAVETFAPLCRQKGVPATFFLTTQFLDNHHIFDRHLASALLERVQQLSEKASQELLLELKSRHAAILPETAQWREVLLKRRAGIRPTLDDLARMIDFDHDAWLKTKPYATREDVRQLIKDGFTIGAHSVDHPNFPDITLEQQIWQSVESWRQISTDFQVKCQAFALPYGGMPTDSSFYDSVTQQSDLKLFLGIGDMPPPSNSHFMERISFDAEPAVDGETLLRDSCKERLKARLRRRRSMAISIRSTTSPIA